MRPESEAELAELIASQTDPVRIIGGGTRGVKASGTPLSTEAMRGVTLYEPGALTLVAKSGTPVSEIEALLAGEGQRLAFEPMDMRKLLGTEGVPTIGGVAAANVSGPRRVQAGACRDFMLGVRMVDGAGTVIKNGGRVMKNVTGYDLVKLLAGSFGTLGVLTEVSLKVLPKPKASACILIDGLSDETAVAALSAALGSPFDVSGAAHIPVGLDGDPVTMVRIEGFDGSVSYRAEKLKELLSSFGDLTVETDPERVAAGWRWVRDVEAFANTPGDVWRISVKPSEAPSLVAAVQPLEVVYDWGGGLIWLRVKEGTDVRSFLQNHSGHGTLIRGDADTKSRLGVFHPEQGPLAMLSRGLRARFDPRGILNQGLMG